MTTTRDIGFSLDEVDPRLRAGDNQPRSGMTIEQAKRRRRMTAGILAPLALLGTIAGAHAVFDKDAGRNMSGVISPANDEATPDTIMVPQGPSATYDLVEGQTGSHVAADLDAQYNMGLTGEEIQDWGQTIDDHNSPNGPLMPGEIQIPQEPQRSTIEEQ